MTEDWRHEAACRDVDPEIFFPTGQQAPMSVEIDRAVAICAPCSVRTACLDWALETGQSAGIWGGLTENQRRACARRLGGALRLTRETRVAS